MSQPLRVLLVEDDPDDAELVLHELRKAGFDPVWHRVETEADYLNHLQPNLDIILSDYRMPTFSGPQALDLLIQKKLGIPFIIISGTIGEDIAVEVMKQGATDYLIKDRLVRLGLSVKHALEQEKLRQERIKAEEELRWKTAFLEAQLNASLDGIIVVDRQGRKVHQNQRICNIFKIRDDIEDSEEDQKQLQSLKDLALHPDLFAEKVIHLYDHPDEISRDEIELKDGTILDRYSSPVLSKDGKHYGRIWTFRDITDHKRSALALLESKRFLQSALNALTSHIAILNEDGTILEVNAAWNRFGLENDFRGAYRGVGDNYLHLCDSSFGRFSKEASIVANGIRAVMTGQRDEFHWEYPCHSPSQQRWFVVHVTRFDGDAPLRIVVAHENITERKLAEDAMRNSEQRYRSLVEATSAIVWDMPASGEFTKEQPGWTAFTGQTFEEYRGIGWLSAIHPDDQATTNQAWAAAVANRTIYEIEQRVKTRDQSYRTMLVRAVPILTEDGEIQEWIGIHTDLTEKKKLEQQFLRAQRMESLGTLAGGIAHDLNNVLTPIMMSIELLRLFSQDERAKSMLDTIQSSAKRGADMVQQILSFARGVEGQHVMISSKEVIEEMQHLVKDTFPKNILFQADLPAVIPAFLGDPTQIHQVLLNLCVNARDAMPNGGKITVSARSLMVDQQYAALKPELKPGEYVMIQVADTGTGIPPEIIEKIFDPFFTTKELGKGTGLGLSTVVAIIKSHGGMLDVESEAGKGTIFTIYIPANVPTSRAPAKEQAVSNPRGHGEVILIVDDEAAVRMITQQTLESFGYRVLLAADGSEAISLYAQNHLQVDIVLTDMMMPIMDGVSTIQVLKRINPKVKIIAASGLTNDGGAAKAAGMGVTHFLPKPYTAQTILKMIHEVLTST